MIRRKSWAEWFPLPRREPMRPMREPTRDVRRLYGYDIVTAEDEIAWQAHLDGNYDMTLGWLLDKDANRRK